MDQPAITNERLQAQFTAAARSMEELRKLYPGCFDANGQPIVAVTPFWWECVEAGTPGKWEPRT